MNTLIMTHLVELRIVSRLTSFTASSNRIYMVREKKFSTSASGLMCNDMHGFIRSSLFPNHLTFDCGEDIHLHVVHLSKPVTISQILDLDPPQIHSPTPKSQTTSSLSSSEPHPPQHNTSDPRYTPRPSPPPL